MKKGSISPKRREIAWKEESNGCYRCISHSSKSCAKGGYPQIKRGNKSVVITRYIYEQTKGKIPAGLILRHKCDNKWCINIDHLETGTIADNLRDAYERGQYINYGETNHRAKLKKEDVRNIVESEGFTLSQLSKKYGIGTSQVWRIRKGLSWVTPLSKGGEVR